MIFLFHAHTSDLQRVSLTSSLQQHKVTFDNIRSTDMMVRLLIGCWPGIEASHSNVSPSVNLVTVTRLLFICVSVIASRWLSSARCLYHLMTRFSIGLQSVQHYTRAAHTRQGQPRSDGVHAWIHWVMATKLLGVLVIGIWHKSRLHQQHKYSITYKAKSFISSHLFP